MRIMLRFKIPVEKGNESAADGSRDLTSLRVTQPSRMSEFERGDDVGQWVIVRDKEALEK